MHHLISGPARALLALAVLLSMFGGSGCRGSDRRAAAREAARETGRLQAKRDSLTALRDQERYDLAFARGELTAARGRLPYLVLDLQQRMVLLEVAGTVYDTLAVSDFELGEGAADSLAAHPLRHLIAAQILAAHPAELEADTTVDKAAAVLARLVPPRPKPLRLALHADGLTVRATASDVKSPWDDLKLFVQRTWGKTPEENPSSPPVRLDLEVEGSELGRLEHFLEGGMPVLVHLPAEDHARMVRTGT